jgi:AraC family transcriptional regulator
MLMITRTIHRQADSHQRLSTIASYYDAVEQVIPTMHQRFDEPLSLQDMADSVALSPHHFNRVFRKVTGIPPSRFLCALRLKAAIHLLLTTQLSITDICFEVGYNSLGTFTTRFTQLIGLPPTHLRDLVAKAPPMLDLLASYSQTLPGPLPPDAGIRGRISAPDSSLTGSSTSGYIFVGLFRTAIPQGSPIGCTLLTAPGVYRISSVPDGRYHVFAVAFPKSNDPLGYLMPDDTSLKVGMSQSLLRVRGSKVEDPRSEAYRAYRVEGCPHITLRPVRITDPPILSAVPLLLMEHWANANPALA